MKQDIEIGRLFDELLESGLELKTRNGYEYMEPKGIKILTGGNRYVWLVAISRHRTPKHLVRISITTSCSGKYDVTVTTDHVCMVMNRDHFFDNVNAKNLEIGDYVQVYDAGYGKEVLGAISKIEDLGPTDDYVYDCEVDDNGHTFYGNSVLLHNSQFVNVKCVTDYFKEKHGYGEIIRNWTDEQKLSLWKYMEDFIENEVNPFVQKLIEDNYHSENSKVLRYSLEYIGDTEIMESKKHYGVSKILSEGPEVVDKIKYSGIELKKATVPIKIKEYLGTIYKSTLTKDWKEDDYRKYLTEIYPLFEKLDINDIAIWKGYNTGRESVGFLQMAKGATGISKSVTYFNQLIERLGLTDKYETITLGEKVRFCYVKPENKYGINCIAFKDGQYPDEFRSIFEVDYETMWEKLIESPLKNFLVATRWRAFSPQNANIMDVNDL
jgi:hypothetical protein